MIHVAFPLFYEYKPSPFLGPALNPIDVFGIY